MTQNVYSMKAVAPTVCAVLNIQPPPPATEAPIGPAVDELRGVEGLAVLAPDALGIVAWSLWKDEMPFLKSLHEKNSILLRSIMPSVTPVNFACMLTGAELEVHGMRTREMDFQCETVYDAVRAAGGASAGLGHKGYSGELLLARYADYPGVAERGESMLVTDQIVEVFDRHRPTFMIAQYGATDTACHAHGPSSPEVAPVFRECDQALEKAVNYLLARNIGVVVLADHGQHDLPDAPEGAKRGKHGTDSDEDCLVPCTWTRA